MHPALASLLLRRRPWHTLEQPFYTSPAILDAELDLIFGRHWIFVGQEPDVPQPGDVNAITVGNAKVLIVRDDDGEVRAFHNVCRHRGAQLVPDGRAEVGNLVCRYHTWTYGLDGQLLFADHMGESFDRSCHGLRPVALRSLEGLLFICLADNPPDDFDEMARAMSPYLAPHRLRDSKIAFQTDLIEDGNWKLTMENNRECYHCGANHPELTVPLFAYGFGFAPESIDPGERAELDRYETLVTQSQGDWERQGIPSRLIDKIPGCATGFRTERLVLDRDGESHTADTRVACSRLMGDLREKRLGGLHFWTQPNSWHHLMSDHAITFCALPIGPERTLLRTTWLVHKDAVEGVDYDLGNLTAVWQATNRQDSDLVGIAQAGSSTAGYVPGPYSPHTESLVEDFSAWYVARMIAGLRA